MKLNIDQYQQTPILDYDTFKQISKAIEKYIALIFNYMQISLYIKIKCYTP